MHFPIIFSTNKEKNFKEKTCANLDATMNLTNVPATQNNTPSANICNSPVFNIPSLKNSSSRMNSYPASSNPSNNNLTSISDLYLNLNLNKGAAAGNCVSNPSSGGSLGINVSNNSNFVCASNYAFGNANSSSSGGINAANGHAIENNQINPNNSQNANNNSNNNANNLNNVNNNNLNGFLNSFFGNGNLNSTAAYSNYLSSYPEIYKSTEEFMENFYSLVNMLKSCITEIVNNEYTIRSLTNIIKNMGTNNVNGNVGGNHSYGNFENVEITQVNYSNPEVFNNNKQNK
jgi:hypothetical protein